MTILSISIHTSTSVLFLNNKYSAMIDKRQQEIKERISRSAMDMWGISDPTQMDPVIDLLLDMFAYNSNRLYQDLESSDAAILHRLARLLVPHKWSLPFPAHALMTVNPASTEIHALSGGLSIGAGTG